MGIQKLRVNCAVTLIVLSIATPLQAYHDDHDESFDGCDSELDWQPTWRDCPRSFDAATPQQIRKQINSAGLACIKPKKVGGDRNGGTFLQCQIGSQPITILSWPKPEGMAKYSVNSFNSEFFIPHLTNVWNSARWRGCGGIQLATPRYMIWVPGMDSSFNNDSAVVVNLRRALGIPRWAKRNDNAVNSTWYTMSWNTPKNKRDSCH